MTMSVSVWPPYRSTSCVHMSGGTSSSSDQSSPRCSGAFGPALAAGAFGLSLASVTIPLRLTAPRKPEPSAWLPPFPSLGPVSVPLEGGASRAFSLGFSFVSGFFDRTIGWTLGQVRSRWPVVVERFATDASVSTSAGSTAWKVFFFALTRTYVGWTSASI